MLPYTTSRRANSEALAAARERLFQIDAIPPAARNRLWPLFRGRTAHMVRILKARLAKRRRGRTSEAA